MHWSNEPQDVRVVLCTVPNEEVGLGLAKTLVNEKRVACVNIVPAIRSIYRWKGAICDDSELLLVMKTVQSQVEELSQRVTELHPYETPELIALPIVGGLDAYLGWVRECATD